MTNATLTLTTEDFIVGHVVQFSTLTEDGTRYELIVGTVVGHRFSGVDIEIINSDPDTAPGEGRPGEIVNWLPEAIGGLIDITALEAS